VNLIIILPILASWWTIIEINIVFAQHTEDPYIVNNTLVSVIQWTHSYKYFQKHAVKPWKQS